MRWWVPVVGYGLSFVLLIVLAGNRLWWGAVVAAVALLVTALWWNQQLRGAPAGALPQRVTRLAVPWAMVLLGAAATAWSLLGQPTDGWGFFGLCTLIVGVGQLLTLWRSLRRRAQLGPGRQTWAGLDRILRWRWWGVGIALGCAAAFGAGALMLGAGFSVGAVALIAGGVLLAPVPLSLLSEDALQRLGGARRWWPVAGGVAMVASIAWLVPVTDVDVAYLVVFGVALGLLVGAIAADTPADVLLLAAVVALLWSIAPRGVPPNDTVLPDQGETVLVAFGDSYMSGEGAREFYNGTNHEGVNACRRAPTAYAPLVVAREQADVPHDLAFVACSGAKAKHIHEVPQHRGEPINGPSHGKGLPQLEHLDWLINGKGVTVAAAIVSIGGNEARFGLIGRSCIGPGDCSELAGLLLDNLKREVAPSVDKAYKKIRAYVGNEVPLLVVPYPIPLNAEGCPTSILTADEHRFIHGYVQELNGVLNRAAKDAGLYYLDDMATVLQDRKLRICDVAPGKAAINFFGLNPVDGMVDQRVNPQNWFHNSLHPNQRGHEVMGDTLQAWLEAGPPANGRKPTPGAPAPGERPSDVRSLDSVMGDRQVPQYEGSDAAPEDLDVQVGAWMAAQAAELLRRTSIPLLLLVAGAWTVWLALIARWRHRRSATSRGQRAEPLTSGPTDRLPVG
jgi:hypothetical protein